MAISIGLDLCNEDTVLHVFGKEESVSIPTVICRDKSAERFYIGEEAYRRTLKGEGVLVDKLLDLVKKDGSATISGTRYEAGELLLLFLKTALLRVLPKEADGGVRLTVSMPAVEEPFSKIIEKAAEELSIGASQIRIISHAEAFIYYVLKGDRDFYSNTAALFDFSDEKLCYYEMKVLRGLKRASVIAEGEALDESFHIDILKNEAGRKLADSILLSCAERMMTRKLYSSVFLTGKGFSGIGQFPQFTEYICRRRRVLAEQGLFARGASEAAEDGGREESAYPYVFLCESRLHADISMEVVTRRRTERLMLASAGDPWNGLHGRIDFIPYGQEYVDIDITPADRILKRKTVRIPLGGFPKRPERCTQVSMEFAFPNAERMSVRLCDRGLGELFLRTDAEIYEEIEL